MKCPKCNKQMELVERYNSMLGESRMLFYCHECDKALHKPIEYFNWEEQ